MIDISSLEIGQYMLSVVPIRGGESITSTFIKF